MSSTSDSTLISPGAGFGSGPGGTGVRAFSRGISATSATTAPPNSTASATLIFATSRCSPSGRRRQSPFSAWRTTGDVNVSSPIVTYSVPSV